jgi:hypothetical protein
LSLDLDVSFIRPLWLQMKYFLVVGLILLNFLLVSCASFREALVDGERVSRDFKMASEMPYKGAGGSPIVNGQELRASDVNSKLAEACKTVGKQNCQITVVPGLGHGFSVPHPPRGHPLLDLTVGPIDPKFLLLLQDFMASVRVDR